MSEFFSVEIETDPQADLDAFQTALAARYPGYVASENTLEYWVARWMADVKVDLARLLSFMGSEAFRRHGQVIDGITPIGATYATGSTTWTLADTLGHTIPAGTQVTIESADVLYGFVTVAETIVPATEDTASDVLIRAAIEGTEANGLSADPTLMDALAFVQSIALVGNTSGGVEAEDPDDFLDRIKAERRLLTRNVIVIADVATAARRVAGVARCLAIDNYDPGPPIVTDAEKSVTVVPITSTGVGVSAPVKTLVEAELASRREVGFQFFVIDPTDNAIKVSTQAKALPGFDTAAVDTAVTAAITDYLDPAKWGGDLSDESIWNDEPIVRRFELMSLVDQVPGVKYVESLTLALQAGTLGTTDVTLLGPGALTSAGTITVTIS